MRLWWICVECLITESTKQFKLFLNVAYADLYSDSSYLQSINYTCVILVYFQYSLVLTKVDGLVGMVIKPEEKKPIFQIKMKTLSNNIPESVKPEVSVVLVMSILILFLYL